MKKQILALSLLVSSLSLSFACAFDLDRFYSNYDEGNGVPQSSRPVPSAR